MKKIAKVCILILIILMTLGLAISNVSEAYCVQPNVMKFSNADYHEVSSRIVPADYAKADNTDLKKYMRDYILTTHDDYTEKERQQALALIEGDEVGYYPDEVDAKRVNKLYAEAQAYAYDLVAQEAKLITLKKDEKANTSLSGENLVYGPIYVTYPMGNIESRRDWGGFYYAFFDEDGNNISSELQLCILENGEYKQITIEGNKDGYNKVTSGSYSGKPLYIVTSNMLISKVFMKAYSFQIVRRARIVRYEGTAYVSGSKTWYCGGSRRVLKYGNGSKVPDGASVYYSKTHPTEYGGHAWRKLPRGRYTCVYCRLIWDGKGFW